MADLKKCRDASVDGQDLLAQAMAARFPEAPRRSGLTPVGVPMGAVEAAPPRPAMLSSPNQVTWMAPAERAVFQAAETNTRAGGPAAIAAQAATPMATEVTRSAVRGRRWWPVAVGVGLAVAAGISIAVFAGRGGPSTVAGAPGSGAAASDAAVVAPMITVDASTVVVVTPDAAPPVIGPPDAATPPPDAGTRHGPGSGHRKPTAGSGSGSGSGSNGDSGIHVVNVGGG